MSLSPAAVARALIYFIRVVRYETNLTPSQCALQCEFFANCDYNFVYAKQQQFQLLHIPLVTRRKKKAFDQPTTTVHTKRSICNQLLMLMNSLGY